MIVGQDWQKGFLGTKALDSEDSLIIEKESTQSEKRQERLRYEDMQF